MVGWEVIDLDDAVGELAVEGIALGEDGVDFFDWVLAEQGWAGAGVGLGEAVFEGLGLGAEVDDRQAACVALVDENVEGVGVCGCAAAEGDDLAGGGKGFDERVQFAGAEGVDAEVGQSEGGRGVAKFDGRGVVEIDERSGEVLGDECTDGAFARAAQADQSEVGTGRRQECYSLARER